MGSLDSDRSSLCLICYGTPVAQSKSVENITKRKRVIFILRGLLELPRRQIEEFQNDDEILEGPESWILVCDQCSKGVEQARTIYQELQEMAQRFKLKQKEIVEKIKQAGNAGERRSPRGRGRRSKKDNDGDMVALKITDKTRKFVCDHDYNDFDGPLVIDESIFDTCAQIKEEIEEDTDCQEEEALDESGYLDLPSSEFQEFDDMRIKVEVDEDYENNVDCNSSANKPEKSNINDEEETLERNPVEDEINSSSCDSNEFLSAEKISNSEKEVLDQGDKTKEPDKTKRKRLKLDRTSGDGDVSCFFCNKQFRTQGKLGWHLGLSHKVQLRRHFNYRNGKYHCHWKDCERAFNHWRGLKDHISIHQGKPSYTCSICFEKVYTEAKLRSHIVKAHEKRENRCEFCGKVWKSVKGFQKHMDKHKADMEAKTTTAAEEALRCHVCGKLCRTQIGLKKHLLWVHKIRLGRMKYPCEEEGCGRVFMHKDNMEAHVAKCHRKETLFHCDECGQGFFRKQMLIRHQQLKHSTEKFVCEVCGDSFRCIDYLYIHRSKYHINRQEVSSTTSTTKPENSTDPGDPAPSICDQCGATFRTAISLKQHIRYVHEQKFPLQCEHCGEGLRGPSHLPMHLYFRHKIGDKPETNVRKGELHQCLVTGCKRRFYGEKGKSLLERHIIEEHGETGVKKKFKCGYCGNEFCDKYKFRQHEMIHTNKESRPFKCDICSKGFTNQINLRYHQVFTHKVEKKFTRRKKLFQQQKPAEKT